MSTFQNISNCALIINALCKGICPTKSLSDYDDMEVMTKILCNKQETIDIYVSLIKQIIWIYKKKND